MSGKIAYAPAVSGASRRATDIVARAWRLTTGQMPPTDDRSFDRVDGDSLRLLQLIFHIERMSGQALPLERFHGEMGPSEFAHELDRLCQAAPSAGTAELPIVYLVPGYGGDEPQLARFRLACSKQISICPIGYPPLRRLVRARFEDIVVHAFEEIERLSPTGPIALAGYSIGGDVAYAVAEKLLEHDRQVSVLCVLDTNATRLPSAGHPRRPVERLSAPARLVQIWRGRRWNELVAAVLPVSVIATPLALRILRGLSVLKVPLPGNLVFFFKWYLRHVLVLNHHSRWADTVHATRLPASVVLFRSDEENPGLPDDLGWSTRAQEVTVVSVRGNHFTMLSPENNELLREGLVGAVRKASIEAPWKPVPARSVARRLSRSATSASGRVVAIRRRSALVH